MPRDGEPDCLVMKKKQTHSQTIIGIDLGDKKHAVCVLGKDGEIVSEFSISNREARLEQLARDYPRARVSLEVGTHSPWISRLLSEAGMEGFVANARKLRAIYQNDRKCDELDARMLAKIARLDPFHAPSHSSWRRAAPAGFAADQDARHPGAPASGGDWIDARAGQGAGVEARSQS